MLDAGFLPDANRIAEACPPDRQLALFSATVSDNVQQLMGKLFSSAEVIRSEGSHHLVANLSTENLNVFEGRRFPLLEKVLAKEVKGGTLIFSNTRDQCDKLVLELKNLQHVGLHLTLDLKHMEKTSWIPRISRASKKKES